MHVLWKNGRVCDTPTCLSCTLKGKRPPQWWRYTGLLERASQHVDQFISPSRFTAGMLAERGFVPPARVLPYFLDISGERGDRTARPHERPYFLFVGRLEPIKGVDSLIDLWHRVTDYDLVVAGTGTHEAALRRHAADNPRIRFLGFLPQKELDSLYYHALACLVPSLVYEAFGLVVIEAFARKTPVIVRDRGALPEIIEESGGGYTYGSDAELLASVERIATNPRLRRELGESGYQAYQQRWSKEAHLRQYLGLIEDVAMSKLGHVPWGSHIFQASQTGRGDESDVPTATTATC